MSPEWAEWRKKYSKGGLHSPQEASEALKKHPKMPEEITCSECRGTGTTEYWEDIEDFINLIS